MPTSYNGWPASSIPSAIGINRTWEPVPGHDFPGGIKGGDVEVVFTYLVRQLHARVEPITIYPAGDEWGYSYRANVNNPSQLSCHASGTAIDYNATEHPNRVDYTWTREQAREIHKIIDDELDGVIKWLEGWDEMHFEIRGTPAQVKAVADRLRSNPKKEEDPMRDRIVWFHGEPTAAGDQADVTAGYRCIEARTTYNPPTDPNKGWFNVAAVWIESGEDLNLLRLIGTPEVKNTEFGGANNPLPIEKWDAGMHFVNGPFKNT